MCGRYAIAPTRSDAWAPVRDFLGEHIEALLAELQPRYNVAPTTQIPIVLQDRSTRDMRAELARWGFIPSWWKQAAFPTSTINARVEEAQHKPMWRGAWRNNRCLIPATHWYEWQRRQDIKIPHALSLDEGRGFMFAGLWSQWAGPEGAVVLSAAILTRDAAEGLTEVHDRMPVVLHPAAWRAWLDPGFCEAGAVAELLRDNAVLQVRAWPVSRFVNRPINEGPECIEPFDG